MAIFLLIGKTSALTMNIAGVAKDWMLIGLSVWLYQCAPSPPALPGTQQLLVTVPRRTYLCSPTGCQFTCLWHGIGVVRIQMPDLLQSPFDLALSADCAER